MINNFIYNTILEIFIFLLILLWLTIVFSIVVPFAFFISGEDYFNLRDGIIELRSYKIKDNEK